MDALRAEAGADAGRLRIRVADVASEAGWRTLAAQIEREGAPLYGLVNNAGVTLRKTVTETSHAEWRRLLDINLDGPFLAIHVLAGLMPAGASIVNTSSTAGLTGYFSAAYTASKWGLRGLTRAAALELAGRGIRVNTVCPGLVETPMIMQPNAVHDAGRARLSTKATGCHAAVARRRSRRDRGGRHVPAGTGRLVHHGRGPAGRRRHDGGGVYWRIGKATGNL